MRWFRKLLRKLLAGCVIVLILISVTAGGVYYWYMHRPLPDEITAQPLFEGITYTREIREEPRRMIVHIVKINLDAPGISFLVTPADNLENGYIYRARTVSEFVKDYDVQLAINGDFFLPWRDYGPWNYYPHHGDGVNVAGLTVSNGSTITAGYSDYAIPIYFTDDNRISIGKALENAQNVISGNNILIEDGRPLHTPTTDDYLIKQHPRTALALDESGRTLMLFLIDGRQPSYSEGATLAELAQIILEYGGYNAVNLDGGGSSTLVIQNENGEPEVLNSPIHTRIPGRERPIANHLGIFASPIE